LLTASAYRLQEKALGGLKPSSLQLLASVADEASARQATHAGAARKIKPGTTLLREWHGVQHRTVLEDGVQFGAEHYRSLSEVAREITGSHWSGSLYFGLKAARAEPHHEAELSLRRIPDYDRSAANISDALADDPVGCESLSGIQRSNDSTNSLTRLSVTTVRWLICRVFY